MIQSMDPSRGSRIITSSSPTPSRTTTTTTVAANEVMLNQRPASSSQRKRIILRLPKTMSTPTVGLILLLAITVHCGCCLVAFLAGRNVSDVIVRTFGTNVWHRHHIPSSPPIGNENNNNNEIPLSPTLTSSWPTSRTTTTTTSTSQSDDDNNVTSGVAQEDDTTTTTTNRVCDGNQSPASAATTNGVASVSSFPSSQSQKAFYELLVHPVLVAIPDPLPDNIVVGLMMTMEEVEKEDEDEEESISNEAIATTLAIIDGLVQEISLHRSVQRIIVMTSRNVVTECDAIVLGRSDLTIECHSNIVVTNRDLPFMDVIIVPNCNDNDDNDDADEKHQQQQQKLYSTLTPTGTLVSCVGRTVPLDHQSFVPSQTSRIEQIQHMANAGFVRIIDYDIPTFSVTTSTTMKMMSHRHWYPINIAVAVKSTTAIAHWRLNEAQYQIRIRDRISWTRQDWNYRPLDCLNDDDDVGLTVFDGATMLQLMYPPKHSATAVCASWNTDRTEEEDNDDDDDNEEEDDDDAITNNYNSNNNNRTTTTTKKTWFCDPHGHGYDPELPNVPLDNLYVSKSLAGENAGRGVFTNVDIPFESYVALETTVYSIHFGWPTTALHRAMVEYFARPPASGGTGGGIPGIDGNIVSVYADAYGFASQPWGIDQETVYSHFTTFVNHGCNGTSNLGEVDEMVYSEFSIDLDGNYIPEPFRTTVTIPYNPHVDRDYIKDVTSSITSRAITAGEELYDNYLSFAGDDGFLDYVRVLRGECSGGLGMVERYQQVTENGEQFDVLHHLEELEVQYSTTITPQSRGQQ